MRSEVSKAAAASPFAGLERGERRKRGGGVAGERAAGLDARRLAHVVDGVDGRTRRSKSAIDCARLAVGARLGHQRSPEDVVQGRADCRLARPAGSGQRLVRAAETGERLRQSDLRPRRRLDALQRRERLDGTCVRGGCVGEPILRGLGVAQAHDRAGNAVPVGGGRADLGAAAVSAFGGRERATQQVDEREILPDAPGVRDIADELEMAPALLERRARRGKVAEPDVDLTH